MGSAFHSASPSRNSRIAFEGLTRHVYAVHAVMKKQRIHAFPLSEVVRQWNEHILGEHTTASRNCSLGPHLMTEWNPIRPRRIKASENRQLFSSSGHPVLTAHSSRLSIASFARRHVRCYAPLPGPPCRRGLRRPHLQGALRPARRPPRRWPLAPDAPEAARCDRGDLPRRQRERLARRVQQQLGRRRPVQEHGMWSHLPRLSTIHTDRSADLPRCIPP